MNATSTISLCMIVKNEETYLPVCLESVKDLVDEMIIIDTGSTDHTVKIARRFNAKVYDIEWRDDFSYARNESLKHATGEWILYLDADERIDSKNRQKIRELITQHHEAMAINVRVIIPQPDGNLIAGFSIDYCRLFRNLPHIRFEGRAHEQIIPSILRASGKIIKSDVTIDHWGFGLKENRKDIRKDRNIKILTEELNKSPNDPFLHYHLAITYRTIKEYELAIKHFNEVIFLNQNNFNQELITNSYMFLAQLYLQKNDFEEAKNCCYNALKISPSETFPYYILATIDFETGDLDSAKSRLIQILELLEFQTDYLPITEIDISQVYLNLGNCFFLQQNYDEAELYYEKAVINNPDSLEINYNLGKCFLKKEQPMSATKWFERVLQINPSFESARSELFNCYQELNR